MSENRYGNSFIDETQMCNIFIPKAVAHYKINNVTIEIYDEKDIPNRFKHFMQKLFLGITWEIYK